MKFSSSVGIRGVFTVEVIKPCGKVGTYTCPNMIVDRGLDMYTHLATGTMTLGVSNNSTPVDKGELTPSGVVALGPPSSNAEWTQRTDGDVFVMISTLNSTLAVGAAVGNISSVMCQLNANWLFSRALILDGDGNPTTLTILADEQVRLSYAIEYHFDSTYEDVQTLIVNGVETLCTMKWHALLSGWSMPYDLMTPMIRFDGSNPPTGSYGRGAGASPNPIAVVGGSVYTGNQTKGIGRNTYVQGSFECITRYVWQGNQANIAIKAVSLPITVRYGPTHLASHRQWWHQIEFEPALNKNNLQRLTIESNIRWGRLEDM